MPRSFSLPGSNGTLSRARVTLLGVMIALLVLNAVAAYFYVDPPGGTQRQLRAESDSLRMAVRAESAKAARFERIAAKVQSGSVEATDFANHYFLLKRQAYESVTAEILQMAKDSNLKSREAVYSEEPIDGSDNLKVMNLTENFEGNYDDLMKFLYRVDKSPSLLILDTLQASPQQHGGEVNASIRFQTVIRDDASLEGVQQ